MPVFLLSAVGVSAPATAEDLLLNRVFRERVALTNAPITIGLTVTNAGTNSFRGFVFSDQIPSRLNVSTISARVNGLPITNLVSESGQDGDGYPSCRPQRWVLEVPTTFPELNPLCPGATLELEYRVTSPLPGTFSFQNFSWAGLRDGDTNTFFGCSDPTQEHEIKFTSGTNLPVVSGSMLQAGYLAAVNAVPGTIYLLSVSSNLRNWVPVATNLSPFSYLDPLGATVPRRFYSAAPYTITEAYLRMQLSASNTFLIGVEGVPGCYYLLEASSGDFTRWTALATNRSPFTFVVTNIDWAARSFFRGTLLPP